MLLKEIVEKKRFAFFESASGWRDAVQRSCEPLIRTGCAPEDYAQQIISGVEKFGPYIVIVPGLAIPHSTQGAAGVTETAVSFVKFEHPVYFEPDNTKKAASIFFALAAVDENEHLKNMRQLFRFLSDEELLAKLMQVHTPEELLTLDDDSRLG